jgi:Fur family peroxide stress response transcriptional regulator
MPKLIAKVSADANFTVIGSSLDLEGICDSCQKKAKPQHSMPQPTNDSDAI